MSIGGRLTISDLSPAGAELGAQANVTTPGRDPSVQLSVVLPWPTRSSGKATVRDALEEQAQLVVHDMGDELDEDPYEGLLVSLSSYLPNEPTGWEVSAEPTHFRLEEESSVEVSVTVRPGDGGIAFALQAFVDEYPGQPVFSEVVVLDQQSPGDVRMLYADSEGAVDNNG